MKLSKKPGIYRPIAAMVLLLGLCMSVNAEVTTHVVTHTFTVDDIQGDFVGNTVANDDPSELYPIICTDGNCGEASAYTDKSGVVLYPVDSEFGFVVSDFVGAGQKERDGIYTEGWAGNIESGGEIIGLRLSNAATDTFKVKYPMGTWCAGLGSNTVKCSTEHYTVLEHLMTCYETIPYMFADPETGIQGELLNPLKEMKSFEPQKFCDIGRMDNVLYKVADGVVSEDLLQPDSEGVPDLPANESTVLDDIAVSSDYGITKKDDGKPLYRFGNLIKRPNDLRMYAQMALPDEWKAEGADFTVTRAELVIEHLITNNPNDQIRPEDMENEGAIGRLPRVDPEGDFLKSSVDCFEGDGDLIAAGTVFKNNGAALPPAVDEFGDPIAPLDGNPYAYSDDLLHAMTNGWYTTTDREPFEWSYTGGSSSGPVDTLGELISGPRWRLKPNKFGQDIPGLEIPVSDASGNPSCLPVPYTSAFIKYSVGEATITTLNLLDFEDLNENDLADDSPLLSSVAWVDASQNFVNVGPGEDNTAPNGISINGLPLTEDFDLAVYVKGDRKPTSIFNAKLIIEYEGDGGVTPPPGTDYDVSLDSFKVPRNIKPSAVRKINSVVSNAGPNTAEGVLTILGYTGGVVNPDGADITLVESYGPLAPGESVKIVTPWQAPLFGPGTILWVATVTGVGDNTPDNNTLSGITNVK